MVGDVRELGGQGGERGAVGQGRGSGTRLTFSPLCPFRPRMPSTPWKERELGTSQEGQHSQAHLTAQTTGLYVPAQGPLP